MPQPALVQEAPEGERREQHEERPEHLGALAMTETGAGSDVMSMRTTATRDGDEYVLNGSKMWITNAPQSDVMIVYAVTDSEAGSRGLSAFIVERGTPGYSTAQKLDKLGMRGSNTCELVFEDCEVPEENVLGAEGKGVNVDNTRVEAGHLGQIDVIVDHFLLCRNQEYAHLVGIVFIFSQYLKVKVHIADVEGNILFRFKMNRFLELVFGHGLYIDLFDND